MNIKKPESGEEANPTAYPSLGMSPFPITLSDKEFNTFRQFIYDQTGINLTDHKRSLFMGRVLKLMKKREFIRVSDYYDFVIHSRDPHVLGELIDRISTNHTYFYREHSHFEELKTKVIPELTKNGHNKNKELRMWCAAASTGQEPYTLAMILKDSLGDQYNQWNTGVLATDISREALEKAVRGSYSQESVSKLPEHYRRTYFRKSPEGQYHVIDSLKKEVTYRRFNLLNDLPFNKPFHIIFLRNVMIYFDEKTKISLLNRLYDHLYPGGFLFIGHAESLNKLNSRFKYIKPAMYQKPL